MIRVQYVVHLLLQECVRQRIQCIVLAAPRAKSIREAQKVFLVDLVEDGDHGLLDNLVFQSRNPQWALPPIFFLYVHSSRRQRSIHSAMNSTVEIDESNNQETGGGKGASGTGLFQQTRLILTNLLLGKRNPAKQAYRSGGHTVPSFSNDLRVRSSVLHREMGFQRSLPG